MYLKAGDKVTLQCLTMKSSCPLVMIEWIDSAQPVGRWQFLSDIDQPTPVKCVSVGWLVSNKRGSKCLAPNMGAVDSPESLQVSGLITIPTRCITRIVKLSEPRLQPA